MSAQDNLSYALFHGTTADLKPGDMVRPAKSIGKSRHWKSGKSDVAYATEDADTAKYFAEIASIRGGEPKVYEVEPVGETSLRNLSTSKKKYAPAIIEHQSTEGFKVKRKI